MKFSRPGIRTWILLLYLVVSIGSLLLLNNVFQTNQQEIQDTMNKLELSDDLRMVQLYSQADSLKVQQIMKTYGEAKGVIKLSLSESRFYVALTLFILIFVSSLIFIVFYPYQQTLREQNASDRFVWVISACNPGNRHSR
jgi:hypothetical protein